MNEKLTDAKSTPAQGARLLFNNSSLRSWQARYKAQKAAEAAAKTAPPTTRPNG